MLPGMVPPELVAAGVGLIVVGGLVWALVRANRSGATAADDRDEAEAAAKLQADALEAAAREAGRLDDL